MPWPPAVVVDLRSERESGTDPYRWTDRTTVRRFSIHDNARLPGELPPSVDWPRVYGEILDGFGAVAAQVLHLAAHAQGGPTLVHCAAGKDRAGVVAAALLLLGGVDARWVLADYLASRAAIPAIAARLAAEQENVDERTWIASPWADLTEEAFAAIPAGFGHGGAPAWFTDHGADPADIAAWRHRLTG